MKKMRDRLALPEAFTIGIFIVVFGILGIASKIQKRLRAVRKGTAAEKRADKRTNEGGSTMRGSRSTARKGECKTWQDKNGVQ
jgi:hypothetical protein